MKKAYKKTNSLKRRVVKFSGSCAEITIPCGCEGSDFRAGYMVYRTRTDHPQYKTIKRLSGKIVTEEIVCIAEPTNVPGEYLLQISGFGDEVLLNVNHLIKCERPKAVQVKSEGSPKIRSI